MALWRVRATVDDRPGFLAVLTASLALRKVNILAVQVHTTEAGAVDDFLLDAPDDLDEPGLLAAIERGRGRDAWVTRADARGLIDPPTQAASLAARLVSDPGALGSVLSTMLGGCLVRHEPAESVTGHGPTTMHVADPQGGTIVLTRLAPSFTPAEFARAQALADVARAALARRAAETATVLPDGAELALRPARVSDDLPALAQLHARCRPETLLRRYVHGAPSHRRLTRLITPAKGAALVAQTPSGQLAALATLIGEGEVAEAALLVEDAWQRRRLGTTLLRRLVTLATPLGFRAVVVHTQTDNVPMRRTVHSLYPDATFDVDGALASATIRVPGHTPALA